MNDEIGTAMSDFGSQSTDVGVRDAVVGHLEDLSNEWGFDHSSNLFESGLLTSLDVLSLVAFIEQTFGLEITGDDIDMASFGTVDGLVAMITTMRSQHARREQG